MNTVGLTLESIHTPAITASACDLLTMELFVDTDTVVYAGTTAAPPLLRSPPIFNADLSLLAQYKASRLDTFADALAPAGPRRCSSSL